MRIRAPRFFSLGVVCLLVILAGPVRAGITIHYRGHARSVDAITKVVNTAATFARAHKWQVTPVSVDNGRLERTEGEKATVYRGKVTGLVIAISDDCEPIHLEFGTDLLMQDEVKTQFAGAEVHAQIVALFDDLKPLLADLEVDDEGEYWDSRDHDALTRRLDEVNDLIAEQKRKNPELHGPYRLPSGRIADVAK